MDTKTISWQERYNAPQIFTLRCKILDKPGMLGRFITAIGDIGAHIGSINVTALDSLYKYRDITVFCSSAKHLEQIIEMAEKSQIAKVLEVKDEVLEVHRQGTVKLVSRQAITSLTDLRMIYTPSVASVCEKIKADSASAWEFTGICDRVAIVTNGTAVLGLGNIGVLPSLPVMEGKAAIFAEFASVSAFPILVDSEDIDTVVETVCRIAAGFGAIQLEDISAPACFEIESKLQARLNIPVFHDDQHGTATVVLAALINALKATARKPENCSVIILGGGAAGFAIAKILLNFGIGDVVVYDSTGPLYTGRTEKMNPYKKMLADITNKNNQKCPLAEGFKGKDIFIGVARPHMVNQEMIRQMAPDPIVFPLSNPAGEITTEHALAAGAKVAADGRTINNALAYPGIFRGALNARAMRITAGMQKAAAQKLAELADDDALLPDMLDRSVHESVAEAVRSAYKQDETDTP